LRDELVFSPCCGGIVEQASNVTDLGKDWLTFLRGSSVLVDRSESLRNLSKTISKSEFDVLLDLASRKMQPDLSAEYAEQLDALGYVVPVPVGYRVLTEKSSERRGRRCDLPHAFAETVTGLGEYVSAWRLNQNQAGHILWKPKSNSQLIYFMEA
jgi:CRISPR type I-F-associated protein Csy2